MSEQSEEFEINQLIRVLPDVNKLSFINQAKPDVLLEPRVMRLLMTLCSEPGRTFTRMELIDLIWQHKWVGEEGLTKAVSELRKGLGDPYLIKTIPKVGYAFTGAINPKIESVPSFWQLNRAPIAMGTGIVLFLAALILLFSLDDFKMVRERVPTYQYAYLTDIKGLHLSPTISSDGAMVAYSKRSDAEQRFRLVVKSTRSGEVLFETTDHKGDYLNPVFSPNSDFIAFVNKEAGYTYLSLVSIPDGVMRKVYQMNNRVNSTIDWSPDGQVLVFNDETGKHGSDLFSYGITTGEVKRITYNRLDEKNPVFSPNGKQLAFIARKKESSESRIMLYDMEEQASKALKIFNGEIHDLDWSEEGNNLIYTVDDGHNTVINKLNISNKQVTRVSNQNFHNVAVSSDENQLVASTYNGDNNIWLKSLIDSSSISGPVINSNRYEYLAQISPDKSKLAYVSDLSGSPQVWEYDFQSRKTRQLTQLKAVSQFDKLSWAPDGENITVGVSSDSKSGILLISLGQATSRWIIEDQHRNQFPQFDAGGKSIFYLSSSTGRDELWRYDLTTAQATKRSNIQADLAYATVSADESQLYFTKNGEEGLWKSTLSGKTMTKLLCEVTVRDFKAWTLFEDGVYYIDRMGNNHVSFYDFKTGEKSLVMDLLPHNQSYNSEMSISSDRSFIVYNQIDHFQSDIVLLQVAHAGD